MGETAVSYIAYNLHQFNFPLVISHNRITADNYFNPLNIVVDCKSRDVAQFLKFLFFNNDYLEFDYNNFFINLQFSRDDYIMLYARLFFPCFYFDLYDRVISDRISDDEIAKIMVRSSEYEKYIVNIYDEILRIVDIPQVDWV